MWTRANNDYPTLYPNCGQVYEVQPMENCCQLWLLTKGKSTKQYYIKDQIGDNK